MGLKPRDAADAGILSGSEFIPVDTGANVAEYTTPSALKTFANTGMSPDTHRHEGEDVGGAAGVNRLRFDINPTSATYAVGDVFYRDSAKTISLVTAVDGGGNILSSIEIGKEGRINAVAGDGYNDAAEGQWVYLQGAQGNKPKAYKASAGNMSSANVVGCVTYVGGGGQLEVCIWGEVNDLNTSGYTEGDELYISTVAGQVTSTAPASPNFVTKVGMILYAHLNQGKILVGVKDHLAGNINLGTDNTIAPTQNAVKQYVDGKIAPFTNILTDTKEPAGFPSRTTTLLEFIGDFLRITPTGASYDYWVKGQRYTETVVRGSGQHDLTVGLKFFWRDETNTIRVSNGTPWVITDGNALVATRYWNGVKGTPPMEERHGLRDLELHTRLHGGEGAVWDSNYNGGELTTDGSTFSLTRTRFFDEDICNDCNGAITQLNTWYRQADGSYTWDDAATSTLRNLAAIPTYDDGSGSLVDVTDGYYVNDFIWHTNIIGMPIIKTVARFQFPDEADALQALPPELPIGQECVVLHRLTYKRTGSTTLFVRSTNWRGVSRKQLPSSVSLTISQISLEAHPDADGTYFGESTVGIQTGAVGNLTSSDGSYVVIQEQNTSTWIRYITRVPVDGEVATVYIKGRYDSSTASHQVNVYARNSSAGWTLLGVLTKSNVADGVQEFALTDAIHRLSGYAYIKFEHNAPGGAGNTGHFLRLDEVAVNYQSNGLLASRTAFSPVAGISSSNVQDAVEELNTEKATTSTLVTIPTVPRLVHFVYGDSTDGGTTPDSTTQASIDALLALGVDSKNIRWLYTVGFNLQVAPINAATTIGNITLVGESGGTFAVDDISSAATIDNIIITEGAQDLTWNPADKYSTITLTTSNQVAYGTEAAWRSVRSTVFKNTGLRYCEFVLTTSASPICAVGIANSTAALTTFIGAAGGNGVMWEFSGNKIYPTGSANGPATYTNGMRICMAWDASNGNVWFAKDGTPNIAGAAHGVLSGSVCPAASFSMNTVNTTIRIYDQPVDWVYAPPTNYVGWGDA